MYCTRVGSYIDYGTVRGGVVVGGPKVVWYRSVVPAAEGGGVFSEPPEHRSKQA